MLHVTGLLRDFRDYMYVLLLGVTKRAQEQLTSAILHVYLAVYTQS